MLEFFGDCLLANHIDSCKIWLVQEWSVGEGWLLTYLFARELHWRLHLNLVCFFDIEVALFSNILDQCGGTELRIVIS